MKKEDNNSRGQSLDETLREQPRGSGSFSLLAGATARVPVITPDLASLSKIESDM